MAREADLVRAVFDAAWAGECTRARTALVKLRHKRLPPYAWQSLRTAVAQCRLNRGVWGNYIARTPAPDKRRATIDEYMQRVLAEVAKGNCDRADYYVAVLDASTAARPSPREMSLLKARAARCHRWR